MSRICCSPFWDARQPGPLLELKTDSMGKRGSSELTSTVAICPRSIQRGPGPGLATVLSDAIILLRTFLFSLIHRQGSFVTVGATATPRHWLESHWFRLQAGEAFSSSVQPKLARRRNCWHADAWRLR